MIKLYNLNKQYQHQEYKAVNNVSLTFAAVGFVSIVGPSGSGKTTLLNLIGGLDYPSGGKIEINDNELSKMSRDSIDDFRFNYIGYILQDFVLIEEASVYENLVPFCLETNKEMRDSLINDVLKSVQMEHLKERKVSRLSSGERQRVAIARTLMKKPLFILADEPTGNLDEANRILVMEILKKISKHHLVIMVTHEEELAKTYADRLIRMKDGEIIQDSFLNYTEKNLEIAKTAVTTLKKIDKNYFHFNVSNKRVTRILLMVFIIIFNIFFALSSRIIADNFIDPSKNPETYIVRSNSNKKLSEDSYHELENKVILGSLSYEYVSNINMSLYPKNIPSYITNVQLTFSNIDSYILPYDFFNPEIILGKKPEKIDEILIDISLANKILGNANFVLKPLNNASNAAALSVLRSVEDFIGMHINIRLTKATYKICGIANTGMAALLFSRETLLLGDSIASEIFDDSVIPLSYAKKLAPNNFDFELQDDTIMIRDYGSAEMVYEQRTYKVMDYNLDEWLQLFNATTFYELPRAIVSDYAFMRMVFESGEDCIYTQQSEQIKAILENEEVTIIPYLDSNKETLRWVMILIFISSAVIAILFLFLYIVDMRSYFHLNISRLVPFVMLGVRREILVTEIVKARAKNLLSTLIIGEILSIFIILHLKTFNAQTSIGLYLNPLSAILGLIVPFILMVLTTYIYFKIKLSVTPSELKRISN